jgi:hypothetical protein
MNKVMKLGAGVWLGLKWFSLVSDWKAAVYRVLDC